MFPPPLLTTFPLDTTHPNGYNPPMNTNTTVTATFIRPTFNAVYEAIHNGKAYSETVRDGQAKARLLLQGVQAKPATNLRGDPLTVYALTLTVAEAVALTALLLHRHLSWPDGTVDERDYAVQMLVEAFAPAVAAAAAAEADAALYTYAD